MSNFEGCVLKFVHCFGLLSCDSCFGVLRILGKLSFRPWFWKGNSRYIRPGNNIMGSFGISHFKNLHPHCSNTSWAGWIFDPPTIAIKHPYFHPNTKRDVDVECVRTSISWLMHIGSTRPETNSLPLKNDGWKIYLPIGMLPLFRRYFCFRVSGHVLVFSFVKVRTSCYKR